MSQNEQIQTFLLPDLGEGLTDAQVAQWLVKEGEVVAVDQSIVEVETAKSVVEVPSPFAGRVAVLHAADGETVDVGAPLISIASAESEPRDKRTSASSSDEATPEAAAYREEEQAGSGNVLIGYGTQRATRAGRQRRPRGGVSTARIAVEAAHLPRRGDAPRVVSPLVRRLAHEHGIDVATVSGTGRGGLVVRADVEREVRARATDMTRTSGPADTNGQTRIPLSGFRKAVSAALSRSRSEIPEATVWVDVDATALWELRESTRTATDPGPGLLAYLARFTVAALQEYPVLNALFDPENQEIVQHDAINLGLAVQSDRGLVVPAVKGAERLTTSRLDGEIRAMTAKAREGRCTPDELSAGTFTINNYGGFGVDGSAAIINHPQVAILGFGRMIERPWVVAGEIVPRRITQMSFVFDHRVCDGGTAAGFMRSVADAIENPAAAIGRL